MYSSSVFSIFVSLWSSSTCQGSQSDCGRLLQIEASLYICTLPLWSSQAKRKPEHRLCGLTQLSAFYRKQMSMIQKTQSMWIPVKICNNGSSYLKIVWRVNQWTLSALKSDAHKVSGELLEYMDLYYHSPQVTERGPLFLINTGIVGRDRETIERHFAQTAWTKAPRFQNVQQHYLEELWETRVHKINLDMLIVLFV